MKNIQLLTFRILLALIVSFSGLRYSVVKANTNFDLNGGTCVTVSSWARFDNTQGIDATEGCIVKVVGTRAYVQIKNSQNYWARVKIYSTSSLNELSQVTPSNIWAKFGYVPDDDIAEYEITFDEGNKSAYVMFSMNAGWDGESIEVPPFALTLAEELVSLFGASIKTKDLVTLKSILEAVESSEELIKISEKLRQGEYLEFIKGIALWGDYPTVARLLIILGRTTTAEIVESAFKRVGLAFEFVERSKTYMAALKARLNGTISGTTTLHWVPPGTGVFNPVPPPAYPVPTPQPPRKVDLINDALFVSHVTMPLGTIVEPGQALVKTWRIKNTGTTTWSSGYKLVYRSGDPMSSREVLLPTVPPGTEVNITVNLVAPNEPGYHNAFWQMRNPSGTLFGQFIPVQVKTQANAPAPSPSQDITLFDISPASPSAATTVRLVGRVKQFPEFRAMRFVAGNDRFENTNLKVVGDQYEISADWNTASLARGDYSIALEVARIGDNNWSQPIRQVKTFTLNGTPASTNRPPDRPVLQSPYNWFLRDASGASAAVQLCVNPVTDPDGDEVRYIFNVNNGLVTADYTTQPCWTYTFGPGNYSWKVKTRDNKGAESAWSAETWNFSVANGGVSIGSPYERVLDPGQTQLCVEVTYGGIQAPEVKGFINTAADGSESGEWRQLDHFGPNAEQCNTANVHGFRLYPVNYTTGVHAIKISAAKLDSGASAQRTTSFSVPFMRPPAPQPVSPSTPDNNNTQWNTRSIVFDWEPALRADSYTLRVSTNPNPFADPSPVLNVPLGSNTTIFSHAFPQDYATLYWSVRVSNSAGNGDSPIASFGIDLVKPACTVSALSAVNYDTVFTVNWAGTDNSSGVRSYDVQVRDTARGDWLDWLIDNPATFAQFTGQSGHSYEFRCRARDKAGNIGDYPVSANTSTRIDPTARPPESWWNNNYVGKRTLNILNTMAGMALPSGYPVMYRVTGATAAEIYNASQSSPKCNDLRVIYNNTQELDTFRRRCDADGIEIWFRAQADIPAAAASTAYQLYFGNPIAGSPPGGVNYVLYPQWDTNTIGLWHANEGSGPLLMDHSGNAYHCTLDATTSWVSTGDRFMSALHFLSGTDGATASCGASALMNAQNFTFEFFFRSTQSNLWGRMAGQMGSGMQRWWLETIDNKVNLHVWSDSGGGEVRATQSSVDGQWHHVAATVNGTVIRLYLDGVLQGETNMPGAIKSNGAPLTIGSAEGGGRTFAEITGVQFSNAVKTSFPHAAYARVTSEPSVNAGAVVNPPVAGSADLAILNVNAYPYLNGAMLIEAIVKNQGTLPTRNNFFTDLYLNHVPAGKGDLAGSARFWVNDSINPGQVVTLTTVLDSLPATTALGVLSVDSANATTAAPETNATLYAQTDSSGFVNEPNVSDNIFTNGLDVCVTTNDSFEDDNAREQAKDLFVGQFQQRNFGSPSDEDWMRVAFLAGQPYFIETSGLDYAADTMLELYDESGSLLASNDDVADGLASRIVYTSNYDGIFYIRVRHWNINAGGCGTSYGIRVGPLDITPPAVTWVLPVTNGEVHTVIDGALFLRATASDNISVTHVTISRWDAVNEVFVHINTDNATPYDAGIAASSLNIGWNQVNATAYDAAGNTSTQFIWIYRTEANVTPEPSTPPPTIKPEPSTSPPVETPAPSVTPQPTPAVDDEKVFVPLVMR